ncbi:MAG TPA: hypothetical protein VKB57_21430 [Acidimicrobiales bacterium]|nr:hypothetical protein [Acidimicrobiales bacterium]
MAIGVLLGACADNGSSVTKWWNHGVDSDVDALLTSFTTAETANNEAEVSGLDTDFDTLLAACSGEEAAARKLKDDDPVPDAKLQEEWASALDSSVHAGTACTLAAERRDLAMLGTQTQLFSDAETKMTTVVSKLAEKGDLRPLHQAG